jgi:glycerol-3-phosphate dehydrogenase
MDRVLDAGEQAIEPLAPGLTTTAAEIVHAVRHEMALRLADVVMRRTALGALGQPTRAVLSWAAALMGKELGWSEERVAREIAATAAMF